VLQLLPSAREANDSLTVIGESVCQRLKKTDFWSIFKGLPGLGSASPAWPEMDAALQKGTEKALK
jgi:hypothetical protein